MIEWAGIAYEMAKDLVDRLKWAEQEKLVDREWLTKSGFGKHLVDLGIDLYWSAPKHIASREIDGWSVVYELDRHKHVRYKLVLYDGSTLIGKVRASA